MPDRYNQPTQGTTNWHLPLNSNFQDLDIHVEHRGPDADKSNVTHAQGAKYLATDTGRVYISTGSAWDEIGTIGSSGEGGTFGSASDPVSEITNTHYREVTNEASVSGDHTVDLTTANVHILTLTGDTTLSFTGDHADLTTGCTLIIKQDSAGGHTLGWGEDMYWPSGTEPSPSTNAGDRHKIVIENVAGDWEGATVGENFALVTAPTVIDDYEWGGTNTTTDFYSGDNSQFNATTASPVQEGSYSLKGSPASSGTSDRIHSQEADGLDTYPQQGDTFSAWINSNSADDVRTGLIFGVQDLSNCYIARMEVDSAGGDRLQIATDIGNTYDARANQSATLSANTWYENEIEWQTDDTIVYTVYDDTRAEVASVSWQDTNSNFSNETGFGYYLYQHTATTATVAYDSVRRL